MNRKKRIRLIVGIVTIMGGSAIAFAHNGVEHLMGTVKAMTENSITVDTVKHETTSIAVDPATTFTYKGAKAAMKDLKAGDRVAVDGKDGDDKKLHAISVRWGATSTARSRTAIAPHKMDPNMK